MLSCPLSQPRSSLRTPSLALLRSPSLAIDLGHWTTSLAVNSASSFLSVIVRNHPSQACFELSGTLLRRSVLGINQLNMVVCLHGRNDSHPQQGDKQQLGEGPNYKEEALQLNVN